MMMMMMMMTVFTAAAKNTPDRVLYLEPAELIRDRIASLLAVDRSAAGSRWFSQLY
jgi:hypothetical protein